MTAEHEVRALIAERYAKAVDDAAAAGDDAALLRAGDKLLEVMDTLPIRTAARGEGHGSGDNDRARVLELVDSPPTVGDTAHP
jgi:hypothetical protein